MADPRTLTRAINALASGEAFDAADPIVRQLYEELHALASARVSRDPRATLEPTDLVHEAFLKLFRPQSKQWESRRHFFGSAARAMQQVLIDRWRSCRGDGIPLEWLGERGGAAIDCNLDRLSESLRSLEIESPELADVVRLRVFAGLSSTQTAEVMGIPERTAKRRFAFAKTWLWNDLFGNPIAPS